MQIIGANIAMKEENCLGVNESEMWLQDEHEHLLGVNDASMFYPDFPPLPDFPCMSSSSSSSSTPPFQVNTATSSSSDSAENNHRVEEPPPATLASTASTELPFPPDNCADAEMAEEPFPYLDMSEINDFFDPTLVFQDEDCPLEEYPQNEIERRQPEDQDHQHVLSNNYHNHNCEQEIQGKEVNSPDGEMSQVFLEWLKTNKDSVSANDLRSVKLKKSTIECAAKRLGGGKEAMKQLLKLILQWVQTSQLQNKRRSNYIVNNNNNNDDGAPRNFVTNPTSHSNPHQFGIPQSCPWVSPPRPYGTDPATLVPSYYPLIGYPGDHSNEAPNNINSYQIAGKEYNMLEAAHSWPPSLFTVAAQCNQSYGNNNNVHQGGFGGYVNQYSSSHYFHGVAAGDDQLMRLGPSATKEARKKRMARQRRYLTHHRSQKHHSQQPQNHDDNNDPLARLASDYTCTGGSANPANWVYWGSLAGGAASVVPDEPTRPALDGTAIQTQNYQTRVPSTDQRRQVSQPAYII